MTGMLQGCLGALGGIGAQAANSDYEHTNALLGSIGDCGYVGMSHQQQALQERLSAMANVYRPMTADAPQDDRLARMVKAFDWDQAFNLRYFDWFFAQYQEIA